MCVCVYAPLYEAHGDFAKPLFRGFVKPPLYRCLAKPLTAPRGFKKPLKAHPIFLGKEAKMCVCMCI